MLTELNLHEVSSEQKNEYNIVIGILSLPQLFYLLNETIKITKHFISN